MEYCTHPEWFPVLDVDCKQVGRICVICGHKKAVSIPHSNYVPVPLPNNALAPQYRYDLQPQYHHNPQYPPPQSNQGVQYRNDPQYNAPSPPYHNVGQYKVPEDHFGSQYPPLQSNAPPYQITQYRDDLRPQYPGKARYPPPQSNHVVQYPNDPQGKLPSAPCDNDWPYKMPEGHFGLQYPSPHAPRSRKVQYRAPQDHAPQPRYSSVQEPPKESKIKPLLTAVGVAVLGAVVMNKMAGKDGENLKRLTNRLFHGGNRQQQQQPQGPI